MPLRLKCPKFSPVCHRGGEQSRVLLARVSPSLLVVILKRADSPVIVIWPFLVQCFLVFFLQKMIHFSQGDAS